MTPMKRMYRQEWVPSIFNDFFDAGWMGRAKVTTPAINVIEKKDEYKVQVAAPGMTKEDFRIHLDEAGDLVISIEKACNTDKPDGKHEGDAECCCDDKECKYLRREFSYAKFEQTLILPDDVDKAAIKAKVKHGVLHIKLPRKKVEERPQIEQNIAIE
ncbi:MAG: Hsp20/alpha crystallin family protein [Bacteroidaceae bacterium]|nr:Hsp20/alpha crystallin family protein [Bacteroidaceae bacterium]